MSSGTGMADDLVERTSPPDRSCSPIAKDWSGLRSFHQNSVRSATDELMLAFPLLILVVQLETVQSKEPLHLIAESGLLPAGPPLSLLIPRVRMNFESDGPRINAPALGPHGFGAHPGQQLGAGGCRRGACCRSPRSHHQRVGAVAADIPIPLAGVGAGQTAQRH